MPEEKKKGFLHKMFKSKSSCCSIELEDAEQENDEPESREKENREKQDENRGGCCSTGN